MIEMVKYIGFIFHVTNSLKVIQTKAKQKITMRSYLLVCFHSENQGNDCCIMIALDFKIIGRFVVSLAGLCAKQRLRLLFISDLDQTV